MNPKTVLSTFVFCFILLCKFTLVANNPTISSEVPATWLTNIDEATQAATEQQKPILMVFSGSDWCKPCIILKQTILESEEFLAYAAEHLILLLLDFPASKKNQLSKEQTAHNEQLAELFNPKGMLPYMVLVDAEHTVMDAFTYKKNTEAQTYIDYIDSVVHKSD